MKKKILGLLLAVLSIFVLVACSSENMDGTYYEYMSSDNTLWKSGYAVEINGDTLIWKDDQYTIDKDNKVLTGSEGTVSYSYENGTLLLDGDEYIQVDSEKYKELIKSGTKLE